MTVHMPGLRNPSARQQQIMELAAGLAATLHWRATRERRAVGFPAG